MSEVNTAGSRVFITGTSSGLNTSALIEAAVAQKTFKADKIDVQIEENSEKNGAYQELQSLSNNLEAALESLTSPAAFSEEKSVFGQRGAFITTSDGSDVGGIAAIAVDPGADVASYNIEVLQKAESLKVRGNSYADNTAALGYTGTFDIGLAGGTSTTINVGAGDSLQDVASAINAEIDTTGVQASVLKVSETEYQLVLTAQDTNKNIEVTNVTGDDVLNQTGVTDGAGGFNNIVRNFQEAMIEVDGVQITRDDNVFDDALPGIELTVRNEAPGTTITLDVDNDAQVVKDAILGFIDAYNALRDFVQQNQQVDSSGNVAEDALLFSDNILEAVSSDMTEITGSDYGANSSVIATIRDIGITFGSNNRLQISDETALDTALLNDYEDVQALFATSATNDNAQFSLIRNTSAAASQDIVFDITTDGGGNITGVTANGDASAFTIDGTRLVGAAGTQYDGLIFSYAGTTDATINASVNQGLADRLVNKFDDYTNATSGLIIQERAGLESQNTSLAKEASEIRTRAERFRESQIEKYAKLESELEGLRLLRDQIRAILGTDDDDR